MVHTLPVTHQYATKSQWRMVFVSLRLKFRRLAKLETVYIYRQVLLLLVI